MTLSYRSESFGRVKVKNRDRLQEVQEKNQLNVLLKSNILQIGIDTVEIELSSQEIIKIPNTAVIICAGGILPTPFLKEIGVMVETHYGTTKPRH